MSAAVAAGCALSRFQSVSVVPTSQCRPHGITKSTLFSVRRIMPIFDWKRSRGITRCTPFEARTLNCPRVPTMACVSSVQTPVAFTTCFALMSNFSPVWMSCACTPTTRSPTLMKPSTRTRLTAWAP